MQTSQFLDVEFFGHGASMQNAFYLVKSKRMHEACNMHSMKEDFRPEAAIRLRQARERRGFSSAKDAAQYFGWPYQSYLQHESGLRGLSRVAKKYARAFKTTEGWLLTGEGEGPEGATVTVPIVGLAGAGPDGAVLFATGDGNFGHVPAPKFASIHTAALEVRGDSMRGLANDGWLIFYDEKEPPSPDHMGEPCVCFLEDGRVLVKTPYPGSKPGHFHLESVNAPMMLDVPVEALALVTDIKPRRSAQRYITRTGGEGVSDVTISGHRRS
jgi:hypothetical protein